MTTTLNLDIENIPTAKKMAVISQKAISTRWNQADKWLDKNVGDINSKILQASSFGEFDIDVALPEDVLHLDQQIYKRAKSMFEPKGYTVSWNQFASGKKIGFNLYWCPPMNSDNKNLPKG